MKRSIVIIGAGMGGLAAAIRLAQHGFSVRVVEARSDAGGLASGMTCEGFQFDAGPYILLDRPGLDWAFSAIGLNLDHLVPLQRLHEVYEVSAPGHDPVRFFGDLEQTARGFEEHWLGAGAKYTRFVSHMQENYSALSPMLRVSHPGMGDLFRGGAWRKAPFLLKSLGKVLQQAGLPDAVVEGIAIWTHVAGQKKEEAPSPMAFVPALMHGVGSYYPLNGIRSIPTVLREEAVAAGVDMQFATRVCRIRCEAGVVRGIETDKGEFIKADAVVSNYSGIGTYLELMNGVARGKEALKKLPLQSPGVCAYLAVKPSSPVQGGKQKYLRFRLGDGNQRCRLFIDPGAVNPSIVRDGWAPARLLGPMVYDHAQRVGESGQHEYLCRLLDEKWWRDGIEDFRVLARRVPADWGTDYHLYANSMNPVMTAAFMRAGRLAHRSPYARGLYLAGSSTHPGQWVSFCAISGILAADCVREDFA